MEPKNEIGVIVLFAQQAEKYGFEIVEIQPAFPDALVKKGDTIYRVEFEYQASSFHTHQHDVHDCDLVICWHNDLMDMVLPVLALSSPDWPLTSLVLPSNEARDAFYWKCRAIRAEREMKNLRRSKAGQNGNSLIPSRQRTTSKEEAQESLLAYVAKHPTASYSEIAKAIEKSKSTVAYYVNQLIQDGRLTETELGWQVFTKPLTERQEAILALLNEGYVPDDIAIKLSASVRSVYRDIKTLNGIATTETLSGFLTNGDT